MGGTDKGGTDKGGMDKGGTDKGGSEGEYLSDTESVFASTVSNVDES
jgi:hypothetical protein